MCTAKLYQSMEIRTPMKKPTAHGYTAVLTALLLHLLCLAMGGCTAEHKDYPVLVERNVMIPMGDGIDLAADIYFPMGAEQAPAILMRTPYDRALQLLGNEQGSARTFAKKGYVVVDQQIRGRGASGGDFYPFMYDAQDGADTIAWIASRPWFNGQLGTLGPSYLGITQWLAAPGQNIAAMYFSFATPNLKEVFYTGGALHLLSVYTWAMMMGEGRSMNLQGLFNPDQFAACLYGLPLEATDDCAGEDVGYFNDVIEVETLSAFLEAISFDGKYDLVTAPAISVAGWYDMFLGPQLRDFQQLQQHGPGDEGWRLLIVGPWGHGASGDGSIDFGDTDALGYMMGGELAMQWFDRWLMGRGSPVGSLPRLTIFVMGANIWRAEHEWPLARTRYTPYYLHSQGRANTSAGDGTLSLDPPDTAEPADAYVYDPLDPVPTLGGNNFVRQVGPYDQSAVEGRHDVLCYSTAVLSEDVEVTGPITAVLYAATDAVDTDFTAKLVDVYPDGRAINIQDGIVRACYRDNDFDNPFPLTPGRVEEYRLDLWATSNVFKAGHRIRVEVSSSNFPRFNRNLNTGEPMVGATEAVPAAQRIYHTQDYPSRIVLPIIPSQ